MALYNEYYGPPVFGQAPAAFQVGNPSPTITEFYAPGAPARAPTPVNRPTQFPFRPDLKRDQSHALTKAIFNAKSPNVPMVTGDPSATTALRDLNTHPAFVKCPWCYSLSRTRVKKENGHATRKLATQMLVFALIGGLIPVALHLCSDLGHYCAKCKNKVAHQEYSLEQMRLMPAVPSTQTSQDVSELDGDPQMNDLIGELDAEERIPEVDGQPRVETDGTPRHEADGSPTRAEMDTSKAIYEMEHVNRGIGTQKRIRRRLKEAAPDIPPVPTMIK